MSALVPAVMSTAVMPSTIATSLSPHPARVRLQI
ncbi:hypothetical protein FB549_0723 [Delftia sp. HK171]|nr:hypothetical protein FB549_0723 [Delftia sp. HK171]